MSSTIKQAIEALKNRVADAYTAVANKGGTLPATQDSANLPTAIASIPSGDPNPYGDVSWWTSSAFSQVYSVQNYISPNDYAVASPFLTKLPGDRIVISYSFLMGYSNWHNRITPSFSTSMAEYALIINTYNTSYAKIDFWNGSHTTGAGHTLNNATIFRILTTIHLVRYMKIENVTSGEVYWKGDRFENYSVDNDLSKANLIKCINAELGLNCYMYLSAAKYAELATDTDVLSALANKPNVTLVQA